MTEKEKEREGERSLRGVSHTAYHVCVVGRLSAALCCTLTVMNSAGSGTGKVLEPVTKIKKRWAVTLSKSLSTAGSQLLVRLKDR